MSDPAITGTTGGTGLATLARRCEAVVIPLAALLAALAAFGLFLLTQGKLPVDFFGYVVQAGFGSAFSWQNTQSRAAPLLLSAPCVALPARLGLVVIGGAGALRHYGGVNETIVSLRLSHIAIALMNHLVEGP
jgi:general nucleoside transport system permease protein